MNVTIVDANGVSHQIAATAGQSIMQTVRDAGLDIAAQCGGCCACATCHVYVDDSWQGKLEAPTEEEAAMLELAIDVRPESRLSCQICAHPSLDGLVVQMAPGSTL